MTAIEIMKKKDNMMKTVKKSTWWKGILLFYLFTFLPFTAEAQQLRFGYLSYEQAFSSMPAYASAQQKLAELRSKYDAETQRVEDEFNKKYEQFLDGQRDFAPSILRKRQSELQELMARNVAFKEEAARLLKQAEEDALRPLHQELNRVLTEIGHRRGYAFILNTDNHAVPYLDPQCGEDITAVVLEELDSQEQ